MKTTITFIITLFGLLNLAAQSLVPFPSPGFHLHGVYHGDWTTQGAIFDRSTIYLKDTMVNGLSFAVLSPGDDYYDYSRYDNGKVYLYFGTWQNGKRVISLATERLLYDFSLEVNDTFYHYFLDERIVDSVATVTLINGETRKYLRLKRVVPNSGWKEVVHWVDGIGDIEYGFRYAADFEGGYQELVCVADATGGLWENTESEVDCDLLLPVKDLPKADIPLVLSSNQAGQFTFRLKNGSLEEARFTVYHVSGRLLLQEENLSGNEFQVDLSAYPKGIYFGELWLDGRRKAFKLNR